MKLLKIVINNFQSIREATVYLDDRGLVSVRGEASSAGADSNGSGKSTLINAIMWCCFNDSGKKLDSADDVVSTGSKGGCSVATHWLDEDSGSEYVITRYRKHKLFKSTLMVSVGTTDITKGTNGATQELVEQILGCDQATFEAYCFARQENAPDIPGMTDRQLKALLEAVLPFDDVSPMYKKASENFTKQSELVTELRMDRINLATKQSLINGEYRHSLEKHESFDKDEKERKEGLISEIGIFEACIDDLESKLKPQELIDKALAKYNDLISAYDDTPRQRWVAENLRLLTAIAKAHKEVSHLSDTCNTCQRPFDNYEQSKTVAEKALKEAQLAKSAHEALGDDLFKAHEENEANKDKRFQLEALDDRQQKTLAEIDRYKARIKAAREDIATIRPNPFKDSLQRLYDRLKELSTEVFNTDKQLENGEARLPILQAVMDTYSPKGIRYHMLETATPDLNASTNYYLSQLTDGALKAEWSTVVRLNSGEYKEKFAVTVTGKDCKGYGSLSGGEKRKVKLACFFALQDLIAKRATKSIDIWCGDEIDHALDAAGIERLMGILHAKTATKSTILVISHNELKEWIPNTATVTKVDGVSQITGYLSE